MANEQTITHFPPLPQHSYNSPNLPDLLPKSSQGSLGPTVLLSLLFPVKYGLRLVLVSVESVQDRTGNLPDGHRKVHEEQTNGIQDAHLHQHCSPADIVVSFCSADKYSLAGCHDLYNRWTMTIVEMMELIEDNTAGNSEIYWVDNGEYKVKAR